MALRKAKEIVSTNPVVVFGSTNCPFCVEMKQLFNQVGASYKLIELDKESDGGEILAVLAEWTGVWILPKVFIGGIYIGGSDTTTVMYANGQLIPLLIEAGAYGKS
ncbi:Glutaredoxin [Hibiscus syriacus]|uniref:Glutaredoxin n=1 Tax=Hibiscus syriacus TaxID=106335 RepID=A0A6A2ZCP2_HIBSY|nr:glutaredoxin-like [Hibiscus syriacus]KAE8689346.1 Glutaredoxin [Hibiscus syriacus]